MKGLGQQEPLTAQFLAQLCEELEYMYCVVATLWLGVSFVSLYYSQTTSCTSLPMSLP